MKRDELHAFGTFPEFSAMTQPPQDLFSDSNYYNKLLKSLGEPAKPFHQNLAAFLKASTNEEREPLQKRLIPLFWSLYTAGLRENYTSPSRDKKLLARFAVTLPNLLDAKHKEAISEVISEKKDDEPVYYVDQWIDQVVAVAVTPLSATDDEDGPKPKASPLETGIDPAGRLRLQGKYDEAHDSSISLLREKGDLEKQIFDVVSSLQQGAGDADEEGLVPPYTPSQKADLMHLVDFSKALLSADTAYSTSYRNAKNAEKNLAIQNERAEEHKAAAASPQNSVAALIESEAETIRQCAKMSIGPRGNHFPLLVSHFFQANTKTFATRENVIEQLKHFEDLDPFLFLRTYKNKQYRVIPNIVIIPAYGNYGFCWEPLDRHNYATGRGSIVIPMFPQDLTLCIATALADFRWSYAKEEARQYWMEEGLTGAYYGWYTETKQRGDLKKMFMSDYLLWIFKEAEGIQKVEKPIREIFWKQMPFLKEKQAELAKKSFAYAALARMKTA